MEINRKTGPEIKTISDIPLPDVNFYTLSNGIPVYEINAGTQEVFKLELVSIGGRLLEDKKLVSRTTATLMKEATKHLSHQQLTDKIDFYGATLSSSFNMDNTSLVMYSLNKYAEEVIPVLADVFYQPLFPEAELDKYISRNINKLKIELAKNDVYAYREFTEKIYGEDHIYGYNSSESLYRKLTIADLQIHFDRYYGADNTIIFLSGKITDALRSIIDRELGSERKKTFTKFYRPPVIPVQRQEYRLQGSNGYQNTIILGRRLFDKSHYDYAGMLVLNTIIGGYFGSRLMKSIREEKGYTYNISSIMDILKYDGFLYISSEVASENAEDTLREIYHQLERLQKEPIPAAELQMVKNYLLGNILNMLDGPFKVANWVKSNITHEISVQRGHEIMLQIKHIHAAYLQELAKKYLDKGELTELVVL